MAGKQNQVPQAPPSQGVVGKQPEADNTDNTDTGASVPKLMTPIVAATDDTDNSEVIVPETPPTETTASPKLTAKAAKAIAKAEAAKVQKDEVAAKAAASKERIFPLKAVLQNNTPSLRAFPELGKQSASEIEAYAQNVAVIFSNQQMLDTFVGNLTQLRELNGWKDTVGVLLEGL